MIRLKKFHYPSCKINILGTKIIIWIKFISIFFFKKNFISYKMVIKKFSGMFSKFGNL